MEFLRTENGMLYQGNAPILLRGMGLGGWLLPEGYMWKFYTKCDRPRRMEALIEKLCGSKYASSFWPQYYRAYITEADIAWIAEQGLNSVRLPLNARHLFDVDENGTVCFCENTLQYVDDCLSWCKKYGIYLILDMHAAPGGQTGQNIDDSEADIPALFAGEKNQDTLAEMWRLLAKRYAEEPAVGGYDLINEPLPKWNSQYNPLLLPLYRRLIAAIREIDPKHVIILEGAHWATDFSVFDDFTSEEAADNIVLQFHKYWSDPDEESVSQFLRVGKRLNAPLWMGEGGENNLQWYTYVFPMYERLGIGWCFWSYKKMETPNSPVTFPQPKGWREIIAYLDGGAKPSPETAWGIFDDFLSCIARSDYHAEVIHALLRRAYVQIPAAAYDAERVTSGRREGVQFRKTSGVTLCFTDGHTGAADWRRYCGEQQPEDQKILVCLKAGDTVGYRVDGNGQKSIAVKIVFHGMGTLLIQDMAAQPGKSRTVAMPDDGMRWLTCTQGTVQVESLFLLPKE